MDKGDKQPGESGPSTTKRLRDAEARFICIKREPSEVADSSEVNNEDAETELALQPLIDNTRANYICQTCFCGFNLLTDWVRHQHLHAISDEEDDEDADPHSSIRSKAEPNVFAYKEATTTPTAVLGFENGQAIQVHIRPDGSIFNASLIKSEFHANDQHHFQHQVEIDDQDEEPMQQAPQEQKSKPSQKPQTQHDNYLQQPEEDEQIQVLEETSTPKSRTSLTCLDILHPNPKLIEQIPVARSEVLSGPGPGTAPTSSAEAESGKEIRSNPRRRGGPPGSGRATNGKKKEHTPISSRQARSSRSRTAIRENEKPSTPRRGRQPGTKNAVKRGKEDMPKPRRPGRPSGSRNVENRENKSTLSPGRRGRPPGSKSKNKVKPTPEPQTPATGSNGGITASVITTGRLTRSWTARVSNSPDLFKFMMERNRNPEVSSPGKQMLLVEQTCINEGVQQGDADNVRLLRSRPQKNTTFKTNQDAKCSKRINKYDRQDAWKPTRPQTRQKKKSARPKSSQEKEPKRPKMSQAKNPKTSEKPYSCHVCGKEFLSPLGVVGHIRNHTGEKPFRCTKCPQKFKHAAGLKYHLETFHIPVNLRPFPCEHCGKRFPNAATFESHMRGHLGIKPYECSHCEARFGYYVSVMSHLRTEHSGQPEVYRKLEVGTKAMKQKPPKTKTKTMKKAQVKETVKRSRKMTEVEETVRRSRKKTEDSNRSSRKSTNVPKEVRKPKPIIDTTKILEILEKNANSAKGLKRSSSWPLSQREEEDEGVAELAGITNDRFDTSTNDVNLENVNQRPSPEPECMESPPPPLYSSSKKGKTTGRRAGMATDLGQIQIRMGKVQFQRMEHPLPMPELEPLPAPAPKPALACTSTSGLSGHQQRRRDLSFNLYACQHCPKTYRLEYQLQDHERLMHKAPRRIECKRCEQTFKKRSELKSHVCDARVQQQEEPEEDKDTDEGEDDGEEKDQHQAAQAYLTFCYGF